MKSSVIPIFIPHLGCPNDCVFCNQHRIACDKEPDVSEVRDIIEKGLEYSSCPQICFYGGSFTAIDRGLMLGYLEAAYPYVRDGRCDSIRLSTRPDAIDREILDILSRYGVKTIELGAQSMSDRVLMLSGRGHTAEDTEKASRLIKNAGFELILQMMVGLPGSAEDDEYATARELCRLSPDGVRIYPTCVIADTPLYDMYLNGRYKALSVEEAVDICAGLADIFEQAGVTIVRLGLNPTDELSSGGVKAGAYHPALGEMVYSRRFYNRMAGFVPRDKAFEIIVPPRMLSVAIGQKKCNLTRFRALGPLEAIRADKDCTEPYIKIIE